MTILFFLALFFCKRSICCLTVCKMGLSVFPTVVSTIKMEEYMYNSCIREFHVYRDNWSPFEGQMLDTARERGNPYDKYAVAVVLDSRTVRHIPVKILKTVAFFLKHSGKATCFFFFFFYLGFTALSRIFHLYRADRSSKVGENRRTRRKTT